MFFVFLGLALADLAFLGTWIWLGVQVNADPVLAERHQLGGLFVCILTCFVHAVTFVYFLGTGLAIKEGRKNWGIDPDYVRQARRFKLKAYPIAMIAIAFTVATGVLGGAVRSGDVSLGVHRTVAVLATALSMVAFWVAARFILRNGYMMGLIKGDIERIRAAAREGRRETLAETGDLPDLLKPEGAVKKPPRGFLWSRALMFLGFSFWLFYAYMQWFMKVDWATWPPFTILTVVLVAAGIYLKNRHPLPADVEF